MKKLLLLVVTALGAGLLKKKMKESQTEQNLWQEATAKPTDTTPPTAS